MKNAIISFMKRVLALCIVGVLCFAVSINAMAVMSLREMITLTYPMTSQNTSRYGGVAGRGNGTNYSESTVPMNYWLKSSMGGGWKTASKAMVGIGQAWSTPVIESESGDMLFKVEMMRQPPAYGTATYWKATGRVWTDK